MPGIAWDLRPMKKYRAHNWHCSGHLDREPYAAIYTTLGCPYKCSFCCCARAEHGVRQLLLGDGAPWIAVVPAGRLQRMAASRNVDGLRAACGWACYPCRRSTSLPARSSGSETMRSTSDRRSPLFVLTAYANDFDFDVRVRCHGAGTHSDGKECAHNPHRLRRSLSRFSIDFDFTSRSDCLSAEPALPQSFNSSSASARNEYGEYGSNLTP
jgi:hypothetical protein